MTFTWNCRKIQVRRWCYSNVRHNQISVRSMSSVRRLWTRNKAVEHIFISVRNNRSKADLLEAKYPSQPRRKIFQTGLTFDIGLLRLHLHSRFCSSTRHVRGRFFRKNWIKLGTVWESCTHAHVITSYIESLNTMQYIRALTKVDDWAVCVQISFRYCKIDSFQIILHFLTSYALRHLYIYYKIYHFFQEHVYFIKL